VDQFEDSQPEDLQPHTDSGEKLNEVAQAPATSQGTRILAAVSATLKVHHAAWEQNCFSFCHMITNADLNVI
jgi:hypothetical protein